MLLLRAVPMSQRFKQTAGWIAILVLFATGNPAWAKKKHSPEDSTPQDDTEYAEAMPEVTTFSGTPAVHAASVMVVDARTGHILYEKNPDEHRPPASTQKLLTSLLIAETGNLNKQVVVEPSDTWAEPVKLNFQPGERYSRYQLLQVLLVHSTNDVARCLARDNAGSIEAFADRMNAKAAELGLANSHFVNPNGLPVPGQYSTARDMARIALAAYENPLLRSIVCLKSLEFHYANGRVREFKNTNKVLRGYALCNGMKTGYTEAAGHCLIASGANGERDVIVVVLGDNLQVWKDTYLLLAWALSSPV
jgi:D-alanyl-D-alanine carboxypeptidase (penicillin-binding protein 5/6)